MCYRPGRRSDRACVLCATWRVGGLDATADGRFLHGLDLADVVEARPDLRVGGPPIRGAVVGRQDEVDREVVAHGAPARGVRPEERADSLRRNEGVQAVEGDERHRAADLAVRSCRPQSPFLVAVPVRTEPGDRLRERGEDFGPGAELFRFFGGLGQGATSIRREN